MFKIKREKLLNSILSVVSKRHLLILGDPGSGKSWVFENIVRSRMKDQQPVLMIKADEIRANSIEDIKKHIGIEGNFFDAMNKLGAGKHSLMVIDALDAARSEQKRKVYNELMRDVGKECPGWSIIASIRTYDALHSPDTFDLFPKDLSDIPEKCRVAACGGTSHFSIPPLDADDLKEAFSQIKHLENIYKVASEEQRDLFHNPFNLRLFEQLIESGIPIGRLSKVQTIVQLLGLYWEYRIENRDDSEVRKNIIDKAAISMVCNRVLFVDRGDVYTEGADATYKSLLSDGILKPLSKSENRISFGHNILFDYFVSRLTIPEGPQKSFEFTSAEKDRVIFLRPSIDYYFSRIWHEDRKLFEDIFWYFSKNATDEHIRLLPTICLVRELSSSNDASFVVQRLKDEDRSKCEVAKSSLKTILLCFRVKIEEFNRRQQDKIDTLVPWADILFILRECLDGTYLDEYVRILKQMVDRWKLWDEEDKHKIAVVARTLIEWAWRVDDKLSQRFFAIWGIPQVCKTYEENPTESKKILGTILKRMGHDVAVDEIYHLVDGIEHIWTSDPEFVEDIYQKVFSHEEKSEETTFLGSRVISLTSTRKQDYNLCYYHLAEVFPRFIKEKPLNAARALVKSMNGYIINHEMASDISKGVKEFEFKGVMAKYYISSNLFHRYNSNHFDQRILKSFEEYLLELSHRVDIKSVELLKKMIFEIIRCNETIEILKILLKVGTKNPEKFMLILYPLLLSEGIISDANMSYGVGELLKAGYSFIDVKTLREMEKTILGLKKTYSKNKLLSCIPENVLQEEESRKIIEELKSKDAKPKNEPMFELGEPTVRPYTENEWLVEKGVDLAVPGNQKFLELSKPIEEFHSKYLNEVPGVEISDQIFPIFKEARSALEMISADKFVKGCLLTHLASSCVAIIKNKDIADDSEIVRFAEEVFQMAARDMSPEYEEKYHKEFDTPGWSPAPRIEAAEGLMILLGREKYVSSINWELVKGLSKDRVPAVRYHIVAGLGSIYTTSPEAMWSIVDDRAKNETTNGVLTALSVTLSNLAWKNKRADADKVMEFFKVITKKQSSDRRIRVAMGDPCVSTITELYVIANNQNAKEILLEYSVAPLKYHKELQQTVLSAVSYLLYGITTHNEKDDDIRNRAKKVIERALESASVAFQELAKEYGTTWNDERRSKIRDIYGIVDQAGTWLYFTANINERNSRQRLNREQLCKYFDEVKPLLEQIIAMGADDGGLLDASTAHYLMQFCNGVLPCDPKNAIRIARKLCDISFKFGYSFDSLAIGEVVNMMQVLLSDHKDILRERDVMEDLTALLNIFVKSGWTEAISLVTSLDEVWR